MFSVSFPHLFCHLTTICFAIWWVTRSREMKIFSRSTLPLDSSESEVLNASLTPTYLWLMILTVLDCHIAWNMRISEIQFPKVLHLGCSIKFHWPFLCGWSIYNIHAWYRCVISSKVSSCCSFFCLAHFQISFSYLNICINLKEMNYLYNLLASIILGWKQKTFTNFRGWKTAAQNIVKWAHLPRKPG